MWKCSTALIKLQKPLPNADGRKIPPFPGQPCPSSCSSVRAGPGISGLERGWEKQRDDPATEGVFFSPSFFSICAFLESLLPPGQEQAQRGCSILHSRAEECQQFQPWGTRKPRDSWRSYLTWVSGEAELAATASFG